AEDGIRDFHVTGVQTCALPILDVIFSSRNQNYGAYDLRCYASLATNKALLAVISVVTLLVCWKAAYDRMPKEVGAVMPERVVSRSEERRVGIDRRAQQGH